MKSFRDMFPSLQEMRARSAGTYICLNLSEDSAAKLAQWVAENNIPNPLKPEKMHVTVTYSRKGVPKAKDYDFNLPIKVKVDHWKVFDQQDGTKCLVAALENDKLQQHHKAIRSVYGATHDFPDYTPHITVSYNFTGKVPATVPDFEIVLDSRKIEAIED